MSKKQSFYQWKIKSALFKSSAVQCMCGWNNYSDCSKNDCPRAHDVDVNFRRIEQSRAEEILASADANGEEPPNGITIMRGDHIKLKGYKFLPGQSVVLQASDDLSPELAKELGDVWAKECPDVRLIVLHTSAITVTGVKDE